MSNTDEDQRAQRAARRRRWAGTITVAGAAKPQLREPSFTQERLAEMWQHCVRQWRASGRELVQVPRSEMPGEVFRIKPAGTDRGRD